MTTMKYKASAVASDAEYDDQAMSIAGWASTPIIDADGDVIDGEVFDLSIHRGFPVLLWSHRRDEAPIGGFVDTDGTYTVRPMPYPAGGNGLWCKAQFSKSNPKSPIIYGLYREGYIRGLSVGMKCEKSTTEILGDKRVCRIQKATLYEISAVNTPANPDAIASVISKGILNGHKIPSDLAEELKLTMPRQKTYATSCKVKPRRKQSAISQETQSVSTTEDTETGDATAVENTPVNGVANSAVEDAVRRHEQMIDDIRAEVRRIADESREDIKTIIRAIEAHGKVTFTTDEDHSR